MPSTEPPETLHALRRAVAETLPGEEDRLISFGVASLDQALAGGLICGALHEIGPAAPLHGGAGFALALAALFGVIGNDLAVTMAAEGGQLQLNAFEPTIVFSLMQSVRLLTNATRVLETRCVAGIKADGFDFDARLVRRRIENRVERFGQIQL